MIPKGGVTLSISVQPYIQFDDATKFQGAGSFSENLDGVDNAKRNSTLSGRYLINTVNHNRDDKGTLHCGLVLQKFGWSRGDIDV